MVKYYPFLMRYRGLSRGVGIISNKFLAKDMEEAEEIVRREYIFWPNAYVVRLVEEVPELIEEREESIDNILRLEDDTLKIEKNRKFSDNLILKIKEVMEITGLSRSTIFRLEQRKEFPNRFKLSKGRVGWKQSEIKKWMNELKQKNEDK